MGEPLPLDVIIAEDDSDMAQMHRLALEHAGHTVQVTGDGAETVDAVRESEPDVVILDLEMPRKDGYEVLEELRADPATAEQPVMVMSNEELTAAQENRLRRLGVADFIAKWRAEPKILVAWLRGWAAAKVSRVRRKGSSQN
ncbi:MAG: PleD family two-component system response regulator [Candidatus Dormibacteria bacterium]